MGERVVIRVPSYRAAGKLQQTTLPNPAMLARLLRFSEQSVFAQVGSRKEIEIFPKPGWIVRMLNPQLRQMAKSR